MLCLDTNTIVYALNRRQPKVRDRLRAEQRAGTRIMIPAIVLFELEYGVAKSSQPSRNREVLDGFLTAPFERLSFDSEDAREAGLIRADLEKVGTPIGAYDVLIAAQARRRRAILVTNNLREFDRVPGLSIDNWAES